MSARVLDGLPPELARREALEAHVEQMIALLDMLDGDPDLEPEEDDRDAGEEPEHDLDLTEGDDAGVRSGGSADAEASLGWRGTLTGAGAILECSRDDREQDAGDEGEVGSGDEEPTLGWNAAGCMSGGDPWTDGEAEPSLGSIGSCGRESMPQTLWAAGSRSDREQDVGDQPELDDDEECWCQLPRYDVPMKGNVAGTILHENDNVEGL